MILSKKRVKKRKKERNEEFRPKERQTKKIEKCDLCFIIEA